MSLRCVLASLLRRQRLGVRRLRQGLASQGLASRRLASQRLASQRPSTLALAGLALGLAGLCATGIEAGVQERQPDPPSPALVRELGLTDLALFTEARYTRHLALADGHAPFQDHPMSFDHFPSASLVAPPRHD